MKRRVVLFALTGGLLAAAASLRCASQPHAPRPSVIDVHLPAAPNAALASPDAADGETPLRVTEIAGRVITTHRLGSALFVSFFVDGPRGPVVRLARVGGDGSLDDVASEMPPSVRTTMRSGEETLSGTPSALLGEPDGPIWMAFTHYSVFGTVVVYRADRGVWRCVGRCPKRPDPEAWGRIAEVRTVPEPVAAGDLVGERSRGHLFAIRNRVSGEGQTYVLPRAAKEAPADAVRRIQPIAGEAMFELADGSIVDVARSVPPDTRIRDADGRNANDFWVLEERSLIHVRGKTPETIPLPDEHIGAVLAEADGAVWLSGSDTVFRLEDDGHRWQRFRIPTGKNSSARVVAASARVLFVVVEETEPRLLRVELP